MILRRSLVWACLLGAVAPLASRAERKAEVNVVVDLTAAGRKQRPPTPDKPVYYFPILGGYQALGATEAGELPPPPPLQVAHLVAVELAKQGYLATQAKSENGQVVLAPPPSLVIAVHWGRIHPIIDGPASPGEGSRVFFNQTQMLALVGGDTLDNLDLNFGHAQVMEAAERNRFFVVLTAFDARAAQKKHQRVQLWQAKMSVPTEGLSLTEVLPALVKSGAPFFGRETKRPQVLLAPVAPGGTVEVGTPTVKDFRDAAPPPASPPAPRP